MKHIIIGTAGHVDHGKSALIRALTGIETDRLKEEKERGLSIELGFAYFDLPDGSRAGIVDVPGHEKFIRNMLSGAYGMDMVLLVVDAKEGMQEQTLEHLEIVDLLGISNGILVITKTDLVSAGQLQESTELAQELLQETTLAEIPAVPVSSITGEGIELLKKTIVEQVSTIDQLDAHLPETLGIPRLYVDRAFTMQGFGVVVTGTLIGGSIQQDQRLQVLPLGNEIRVRGVQVYNDTTQIAIAGQRTALNLSGIGLEQVQRGDVLCPTTFSQTTNNIDVDLRVLNSFPRMLEHWTPLRFYIGTREVFCRAIMLVEEAVLPGETVPIQLRLDEPILTFRDDRFILRDTSAQYTVGGGRVLNPFAQRHKRLAKATIHLLEQWSAVKSPTEILSLVLQDQFSAEVDLLRYYLSLAEKNLLTLLATLEKEGQIIRWSGQPTQISLADRVLETEMTLEQELSDYHQSNPLAVGLNLSQIRDRLGLHETIFEKVIERMVEKGQVSKKGNSLRLADHQIAFEGQEAAVKSEIEQMFQQVGINAPSLAEIVTSLTDYPEQSVRETFFALVNLGTLIKIEDGIFIHQLALESTCQLVIDYLRENGIITVAEFRELARTSRKYAVPFLEYCDSKGLTHREGDHRKLRGGG